MHAIDNLLVHDHFTLLRNLQEKDFAFVSATIAVGKLFNEEYPPILVKFNFPIDQIGNGELDRRAAGLFCYLVEDLLGEGMKQQRAVSLSCTDHDMQGLAPASSVLLFAVPPCTNE